MGKRKQSSLSLPCKKLKKTKKCVGCSTLPEVFFDEQDLNLDSFAETSLLDESVLLADNSNQSTSDEDLDLPEGLMSLQDEQDAIKSGDVVWVKHDAKDCFWPAYVKEASGKHIKVFYICYNRFAKGERTFKFAANSKRVKTFCSVNNITLIEDGRENTRLYDEKQPVGFGPDGRFAAFNKAVNLAETYILEQGNQRFANEQDVFDFFQSDGVSLCHQKCVEEQKTVVPPQCTIKPCQPPTHLPTMPLKTDLTTHNVSVPTAVHCEAEITPKRSRSRTAFSSESFLHSFNNRNTDIVSFIIDGQCSKHLKSVLDGSTFSMRMEQYLKRWPKGSSTPVTTIRFTDIPYFEDEQQLQEVCSYLNEFIGRCSINCNGIVQQDDLLFTVLLPEASIYAISKVRRRKITVAEKMYMQGCKMQRRGSDPQLNRPLTEEERFSVQRRISGLAEDLAILQPTC
uniref:Uncharacterized protein LOC100187136 n=1 Tax=Phallusia mammillata TaxID=59560 RepID=A0A6F9DJC2_9ASCI|nr:uncharacterized protein LOC100187136 [Phallusia mammillata]